MAAEVAQKLSIPKFNLKQVKWVTGIQTDRVSFVMRHFKVLLLPLPLKELFLPEKWKPFITSDIMLGRVPGQRRLAATTGGLAVILILGSFALSLFVSPVWLQAFGVGVGLPVAVYLLLRAFNYLKTAVLLVDKLAASAIGTDSLLQVLKRIEGLKLPDVERRKARGKFAKRFGWPDIERIETLQATAPQDDRWPEPTTTGFLA